MNCIGGRCSYFIDKSGDASEQSLNMTAVITVTVMEIKSFNYQGL